MFAGANQDGCRAIDWRVEASSHFSASVFCAEERAGFREYACETPRPG